MYCMSVFLRLLTVDVSAGVQVYVTAADVWPLTFWPSIAFLISSPLLISSTAELPRALSKIDPLVTQ